MRLTVGIMDIDWQKIVASMQNAGSKSGSMGILVGISAAATQQIIDQTGQYLDLKAGGTGEINRIRTRKGRGSRSTQTIVAQLRASFFYKTPWQCLRWRCNPVLLA